MKLFWTMLAVFFCNSAQAETLDSRAGMNDVGQFLIVGTAPSSKMKFHLLCDPAAQVKTLYFEIPKNNLNTEIQFEAGEDIVTFPAKIFLSLTPAKKDPTTLERELLVNYFPQKSSLSLLLTDDKDQPAYSIGREIMDDVANGFSSPGFRMELKVDHREYGDVWNYSEIVLHPPAIISQILAVRRGCSGF